MLTLSFIGPDSVPALADYLLDPREGVRVAAAGHLGQFGAKARPVLPALLNTLNDPSPWVREITTNTLRKIAPEELEKLSGSHS
jgi:HEAT repeat protein